MDNPPPPPTNVRRCGNAWTFAGESYQHSPAEAQNVLTELGKKIERKLAGKGEGGSRRKKFGKEDLNALLDAEKKKILSNSIMLMVRNGADITAVVKIINHGLFSGAVQVANNNVQNFIFKRLGKDVRDGIIFLLETDAGVDEPPVSDSEPPSSDSGGSGGSAGGGVADYVDEGEGELSFYDLYD